MAATGPARTQGLRPSCYAAAFAVFLSLTMLASQLERKPTTVDQLRTVLGTSEDQIAALARERNEWRNTVESGKSSQGVVELPSLDYRFASVMG